MTALFFIVLAAAIAYGLHRLTTPKLVPARVKRNDGPSGPAPRNDYDWSGR